MRDAKMLFANQISTLTARHGQEFWDRAERLVGYSTALGGQPANALIEYTLAYLKEQARYLKTGEYSHSDFDDVRREVYDNPDVMQRFYLDGLLLTHAFWPIHFDMHHFFATEFLPRVPNSGVGTEFGFGHGLYLLETLTTHPETRARGFDISEFSVSYAGRLLTHGQVDPARFALGFADVRQALPIDDASFSWAVFAEIIEHIPDPAFSLRELRRTLQPGAPVFATTVIHSNALDHIYQFADVEEVRSMLKGSGFELLAERVLKVRDYDPAARDPSVDVAFVCRAS
jgi:SAM-dependent methyltransferase